jgi:hypothetical protein
MPLGTFYENERSTFTAFSFVVEIDDPIWVTTVDATLPQLIPAVVLDPPGCGTAKALYGVLAVGSSNAGPVRVLAHAGGDDGVTMIPLMKGDSLTIQLQGRQPDGAGAMPL